MEIGADAKEEASQVVENTSGGRGYVPNEARGWNWGAFWFTWLWCIVHRLWIVMLVAASTAILAGFGIWTIGSIIGGTEALFIFYALVASLAWRIVLGVRGNHWAWQHRKFKSIEQFKETQKYWAQIGWILVAMKILTTLAREIGK